jgi:hypothetical protein
MTQLEWPGARVRAAFNEFFQSKAHTVWPSNAVVRGGGRVVCGCGCGWVAGGGGGGGGPPGGGGGGGGTAVIG